MKSRILAISFFGSTKHQLRPFENIENVDVVVFESNPLNAGIPGTIEDFEKLGIDYSKYFAVITWGDSLFPVIEYFFKNCIKNKISIYGNQHGINKSILQIIFSAPNKYCKYWNAEGTFMLERFRQVLNVNPINNRWISIGSPHHEYLYKNYKWDINNNNNRILLIHEPNLNIAEGDKYPHDSEEIIDFLIKFCNINNYQLDLKVHPNWKGETGNTKHKIRKFNCNYVDISFDEIIKYSLVIGSRSSLLYESYIMGIPVIAIKSHSDWPDDLISFISIGIVESFNLSEVGTAINLNFNSPKSIDLDKVNYLSGPIGKILDNYLEFIDVDKRHPKLQLGEAIYLKFLKRLNRSYIFDLIFSKYINYVLHKIIIKFPVSYRILRYLR